LAIWQRLIGGWLRQGRLRLVFVSHWMQRAFLDCVGLDSALVEANSAIIPNSIHPVFLASSWQPREPFAADFVTIRPLDNPKYAVDQVRELALAHPQLRFDVYGRGRFFAHYPPPPNLSWFDRFLKPEEMVELLGRYRAALMPTRLDAQGVMMCELASFDMPVLTSDLPICREMLAGFPRVTYLEQDPDLNKSLQELATLPPNLNRTRFAPEVTIAQELQLIESFGRPKVW
ncbi:MAG TPA: hypothetical protein V6D23_01640, partial [Candidatus Obscuribacterales bacterium]